MKITVFAPHPDDEILGCGGSIAKHVSRGHHVTVVYMTDGSTGSGIVNSKNNNLCRIRKKEAVEAAECLGIRKLIFLNNRDGYLCCSSKNISIVKNIIIDEKPRLIYLPHYADRHKDHVNTYKIVFRAVKKADASCMMRNGGKILTDNFPLKTLHLENHCQKKHPHYHHDSNFYSGVNNGREIRGVEMLLCYEVWAPLRRVSIVEDITDYIKLKIKAIELYKSQDQNIRCTTVYKKCIQGEKHEKGEIRFLEYFQIIRM